VKPTDFIGPEHRPASDVEGIGGRLEVDILRGGVEIQPLIDRRARLVVGDDFDLGQARPQLRPRRSRGGRRRVFWRASQVVTLRSARRAASQSRRDRPLLQPAFGCISPIRRNSLVSWPGLSCAAHCPVIRPVARRCLTGVFRQNSDAGRLQFTKSHSMYGGSSMSQRGRDRPR
jgi:hypothetical protein